MGQLIAKVYPTKLFLKAADHTYVECGTGAIGWGCWGGKQDGKIINSGNGSTTQAKIIAEPDEKAGIKRYLIDGVCHQAANRILFPSKKLVLRARGYGISEIIFGPYGKSKFDKHENLTGDPEECITGASSTDSIIDATGPTPREISEIGLELTKLDFTQRRRQKLELEIDLFELKLKKTDISSTTKNSLLYLRKEFFDEEYENYLPFLQTDRIEKNIFRLYVNLFNRKTMLFQRRMQSLIANQRDYKDLTGLDINEKPIILADPACVEKMLLD